MPEYGSANPPDATSFNLLRSGTVVARQLTTGGAQVQVSLPDRGITTDWIPVGQTGSAGTISHFCPRIGDNVVVASFGTGIEMGTVIATNCTPNNPSFQPRSLNSTSTQFDDGSLFEYDPDAGCLSINGVATIYVNALGQVQIIAGGDIDVTTRGNCNVTVSGNLTASVTGNANVTAATATIQAATITLEGNVMVTGTLQVMEAVQFDSTGTIASHLTNLDGEGGGS
jgi:phage baseplate assembly protein V